jgi:hypothetical protein
MELWPLENGELGLHSKNKLGYLFPTLHHTEKNAELKHNHKILTIRTNSFACSFYSKWLMERCK